MHSDAAFAQRRRQELVADYGVHRINSTVAGAQLDVGELLARYFRAPHGWTPATTCSHRPVVEALIADRLAYHRLFSLTAGDVADSGARRGELAVLRLGDLDGRVLTIERGLSRGVLGSTKTDRTRRLTLGATTVALITAHFAVWDERGPARVDDWLFAPDPTRCTFTKADSLSHKFRRLGLAAGVERPALHRLRHAVATHLVEHGHLLKAQGRLGRRDPATTLRHYSHATPLDDQDIADDLNDLLDGR